MLCALAHGRGYVVKRGVGEPGGKPACGPIRVGGGAGAFAPYVGVNPCTGGSHESSLVPVIFSFLVYSILELARHFDQTKASRFLLTISSTVVGWRSPISAI